MGKPPVVTIDGPSGSGKGAVSERVAQRLGWHYLDSGALYRALGVVADRLGLALDDEAGLARLAEQLDIAFEPDADGVRVRVAGEDISGAIRTEAAGSLASRVGALPRVRQGLLQKQHRLRQAPGLVADGRDMGAVIFPDAVAKIYLTASPEVRAERRYRQLKAKGFDVNLPRLLGEIRERDRRDAERAASPLKPAEDAYILDTSGLNLDEVIEAVFSRIQDKLK